MPESTDKPVMFCHFSVLEFSGQVEEVKKFLEDPDAYAAANPVAAAPAASGGGEAKKEEKKARNYRYHGRHHGEDIEL